MKDCLMCGIIDDSKKNKEPFFVKELTTGYVVMSWHQFFKGYVLFVCKNHIEEIHELDDDFRGKFLNEMVLVGKAVYLSFKPKKMNYATLGNSDPHLHWHIIPRYGTDPKPENTIWSISEDVWQKKIDPNSIDFKESKERLKKQIEMLYDKNWEV